MEFETNIFPGSGLISLVLFLLLCVISYGKMNWLTRTARLLSKFPRVRAFPLIGSVWMILKNPSPEGGTQVISHAVSKKGRKSVFWMGHKPYVILADAGSVQKALSAKTVEIGSDYNKLRWLLGNGLLTAPHDIWQRDHKILSPSFRYQKLRGFIPIFNKNSRKLMEILEKNEETEIDFHPLLCRCLMDSTAKAVFGRDTNFQEDLESEFMKGVYMGLDIIRTMILRPYLCLPGIEYLSGIAQQKKKCKNQFHGYVEEAQKGRVEETDKTIKKTDEDDDDSPFIDILLAAKKEIPELDITGHIITIFSGGFETTSTCLNYVLFLLAHHPEIQEKVQAEQDAIFSDNQDRTVTYSDMTEMKYLEMCIKETLRLLPSVPLFFRTIDEDVELDDGLTIPAGVDIFFALYELHRDPAHFPDPETFNPDRFQPELCAARNPWAYIPFAIGPRYCPGFRYAMLVMKSTLSHIFRKYTITAATKWEDVKFCFGVVLEPKPHFKCVLTPRNKLQGLEDNCSLTVSEEISGVGKKRECKLEDISGENAKNNLRLR